MVLFSILDATIQAPKISEISNTTELEITQNPLDGVILQCISINSILRIRVISDGYHKDWNVQFPKDIREEGAKYVVDEIQESKNKVFYRVIGDIKKLKT